MAQHLPKNPARLWGTPQVRDFIKQAKQRVGGDLGWGYLSTQMQEALLDQQTLRIVTGLARGEIPCAAIACLRSDMLLVAGLVDSGSAA